ncbi:unnamed protein product [Peniophora sp. CBMAI 1063]|nr:unnamed protein product [Peniophora sp. CBMAI 1063]
MSDTRPSFPLPALDVRCPPYAPGTHWLLVLQGSSCPAQPPIYFHNETSCSVVVDDQGRWGAHEWPSYPQLYDSSSPWLGYIPLYLDNHHITRSTIHRKMIVQADKTENQKEMLLWTAEPELKEKVKEYGKGTISQAEGILDRLRRDAAFDDTGITWPAETIKRATHLWRLLVTGLPSVNAFKRALTCFRRATLELEGFHMWSTLMLEQPNSRFRIASLLKSQRNIRFRGVFLGGSRGEWEREDSKLLSTYNHLSTCDIPVYCLVKQTDWKLHEHEILEVGSPAFLPSAPIQEREQHQLQYYCYPPAVSSSTFERVARGLLPHPDEGKVGALEDFWLLNTRRLTAQIEQHNARNGDLWKKAVGANKRPHPELQARINVTNAPPSFMAFWQRSDVFSALPPTYLSPDIGKGTLLPRPSQIWGLKAERRARMLETLTVIWKLLLVRPCLLKENDLSVQQAYLNAQGWRDILNRTASDTVLSAMWTGGKLELWGSRLQPSVIQRAKMMVAEPTLAKMDCNSRCTPLGKFGDKADPAHLLEHFVLFRLVELHVLHDFASYNPGLQRTVDGRWCPPPFDVDSALKDRPGAFGELAMNVSEMERESMEEIVAVVRWNGLEGVRAWEMEDGVSYRSWLTAFRTLLGKCPGAWTNNPVLDDIMSRHADWDLPTADLHNPSAPIPQVTRLLIGTHMLLTMRAGRLPWPFFNKPQLDSLECRHDS